VTCCTARSFGSRVYMALDPLFSPYLTQRVQRCRRSSWPLAQIRRGSLQHSSCATTFSQDPPFPPPSGGGSGHSCTCFFSWLCPQGRASLYHLFHGRFFAPGPSFLSSCRIHHTPISSPSLLLFVFWVFRPRSQLWFQDLFFSPWPVSRRGPLHTESPPFTFLPADRSYMKRRADAARAASFSGGASGATPRCLIFPPVESATRIRAPLGNHSIAVFFPDGRSRQSSRQLSLSPQETIDFQVPPFPYKGAGSDAFLFFLASPDYSSPSFLSAQKRSLPSIFPLWSRRIVAGRVLPNFPLRDCPGPQNFSPAHRRCSRTSSSLLPGPSRVAYWSRDSRWSRYTLRPIQWSRWSVSHSSSLSCAALESQNSGGWAALPRP